MTHTFRRLGIALGSFVIAYLALSLVAGVLFGPMVSGTILLVAAAVLGAAVYVDILRRERRPA
jgi:uncharacterized membrane protein YdjX (TVP38/TMEM64 family)